MTSQERPVEEQPKVEHMIDNGAVAVIEHELPTHQTQEEAATSAEQAVASSANDVERVTSVNGQQAAATNEQVERAVGEAATEQPATVALPTEPSLNGDESSHAMPAAADDVEPVAATTATTAEPVDTAPVAATPSVDTPASEAVSGETPAEAASNEATSESVSSETAPEAGSDATAAEAPSEEASFTPVAEGESTKPRRVKDLQPGMELDGRVTSIALYGIFVDIGVGRDGLVHISEMSNTRIDSPSDIVQIGDTVHVRVKSVEPDGRRISLTMRTSDGQSRRNSGGGNRKKPELDRERLANLRIGDTIEGTVTGIAQFGVFVDIGAGKDGLVHISELSEGRVDKAEDAVQVGHSYIFKILEVDAEGTRISLSLRRAQRAQRLQELEKGQILEGTISGIAPFGAFVDIGVGRDGLVHISELSENRVGKVEDVVKVGDKVQVRVLEMEANSKRISLSMVLEERPQEEQSDTPATRATPSASSSGAERTERPERVVDRQERPRREFPSLQDRQERQERARRDERPRRDERQPMGATTEVYATQSEEAETPDQSNATLEDLLSKFGGRRPDKKRRADEEEIEEDETTRSTRRQRDVIRRTLQTMGDDE